MIEQTYKSPIIKDFIQEFGFSYFEILRNKFLRGRNSLYKFANNYMLSPRGERFPVHRIFRELEDLDSNNKSSTYINQWKKIIDNELKGKEILYFPTYRRVEEDLYNLGFDEFNEEELDKNTLIQFGMNDVKKSFKNIQNTINKLLREG